MILGLDWTDIHSDSEKDQIIETFREAGFEWADPDDRDPSGAVEFGLSVGIGTWKYDWNGYNQSNFVKLFHT